MLIKKISLYFLGNNRLERIWKISQVDFKKRYNNDNLGIFWALLNPVFRVAVYYLIFTYAFEVKENNYAFFIFSGILIWNIFSESTKRGMYLLLQKKYLIDNIQFNWIDIYYSFLLSILYGFIFNLVAYLIISIGFGVIPPLINLFFMPLILLQIFSISMGFVLMLSVFYPFIKDLDHLWDMILLLGFWSSGIFFRSKVILEKLPFIEYFNPFIGIIYNSRATIMPNYIIDYNLIVLNSFQCIIVLLAGIFYFNIYRRIAVEKI